MDKPRITYSPRHRVTVRTASDKYATEIDISKDVLSIHTGKVYGLAAGGWQILTTFNRNLDSDNKTIRNKRYDEWIKPDDMILIELDAGDGNGLQKVMRGLVNRPARRRSISNEGIPVRHSKLSGQDMGKLLSKHDVGWDIGMILPDGSNMEANRSRLVHGILDAISGTPSKIVKKLFEELFSGDSEWNLIPELTAYYKTDWIKSEDNWEMKSFAISNTTGGIWSAMKQVANDPWNQLYTDTDEKGFFQIGLEQIPHDPETGRMVATKPTHKISDIDIIEDDLGVDDGDMVNFLYYDTSVMPQQSAAHMPWLFGYPGQDVIFADKPSIRLHGYRSHTPQTNFIPPTDDMRTPAAARAKAFWNIHKNNHTYESGSAITHLRPEIRVGNRLLITDTNKEYFIEQVDHEYNVEQLRFTTTLGLTRGQYAAR